MTERISCYRRRHRSNRSTTPPIDVLSSSDDEGGSGERNSSQENSCDSRNNALHVHADNDFTDYLPGYNTNNLIRTARVVTRWLKYILNAAVRGQEVILSQKGTESPQQDVAIKSIVTLVLGVCIISLVVLFVGILSLTLLVGIIILVVATLYASLTCLNTSSESRRMHSL